MQYVQSVYMVFFFLFVTARFISVLYLETPQEGQVPAGCKQNHRAGLLSVKECRREQVHGLV